MLAKNQNLATPLQSSVSDADVSIFPMYTLLLFLHVVPWSDVEGNSNKYFLVLATVPNVLFCASYKLPRLYT